MTYVSSRSSIEDGTVIFNDGKQLPARRQASGSAYDADF
jgi:hypothetical protein